MNIRFSPDSIRMRVSLAEASDLESQKKLVRFLPFADGEMSIEAMIVPNQDRTAIFAFTGKAVKVSLREREFRDLLAAAPSRDSRIEAELESSGAAPLEIDLASRKERT